MVELCACPSPLRDTSSPTRRFHCARCAGVTPFGKRLSLDETRKLIGQAHSLLDRLLADITYANEAVYGIRGRPEGNEGKPKGSHANPSVRYGRGNLDEPDPWDESAALLALAAQWVKQATAWLINADEAAGLALLKTETHRGPAQHTPAPFHDSIPANRPDLAQAHAAKNRRGLRGEL